MAAPVLIGLALAGARWEFALLLTAAILTDALDGWIARRLNQQSELGARLDSAADTLTYLAAITGIFAFEVVAIGAHMPALYLFIAALAASTVAPFLKFGRAGSHHLYSFKAAAVVQTAALLWLFYVGFDATLFYLAIGVGILACAEDVAVTLALKSPRSNVQSLFKVLRETRR